jgi:hypothetical protein
MSCEDASLETKGAVNGVPLEEFTPWQAGIELTTLVAIGKMSVQLPYDNRHDVPHTITIVGLNGVSCWLPPL